MSNALHHPLTEEQKGEYLLNKGGFCPHCGSEMIEGDDSPDFTGESVAQEIVCRECDARWLDVYTLNDIIPL